MEKSQGMRAILFTLKQGRIFFFFFFFWKFGFVGKRMGNREIIKRKENDYIYNQYYLKY